MRSESKKNFEKTIPEQVSKKIYLDKKELAAEKMIKIWESLAIENNISSKSINWIMFKLLLKIMKQKIFSILFTAQNLKKIEKCK